MPNPVTNHIERLVIGEKTACYFIRPGSRSRPWHWFEPYEVPPFEGRSAWFEMERVRGGWKFIREVAKPW